MWRILIGALAAASTATGGRFLEFRGVIEPAPVRAMVSLDGVTVPFNGRTRADAQGRFRFRRLTPGAYVVTVFAAGAGVTRRSAEITPGLADSKGCVTAVVPLSRSTSRGARPARLRGTVSVSELAIPDRARREYEAARKLLRKGDAEASAAHLKRVVDLAPQYVAAWMELGGIASRSGKWAEAETYFRRALELRPGSMMGTLNLGAVLLYLEKPDQALPYNLYAAQQFPENAVAHHQLGMSYLMLKREDEAVRCLVTAKELDPAHYSNPQLTLASIYIRRGHHAAAIHELEDFLARHPDGSSAPRVRDELARLKQSPASR